MKSKLLLFLLFIPFAFLAQETPEEGIKKITDELNALIQSKKDSLQINLASIDERLKKGEITEDESVTLRKEANETYATELDDILYEKMDEIWVKKGEIDTAVFGEQEMAEEEVYDSVPPMEMPAQKLKKKLDKIGFMFAFGFNNMILDNDFATLDDSKYSLRGSTFLEFGWNKNIPLIKESKLLKFRYGLNFKYSELKLFSDQFHADLGDVTAVQYHLEELKKSKLTTSQVLIPLEFEFDFGGKTDDNGKYKKGFIVGLGGYAGMNYFTKEVIKFKDAELRKQYNFGNFNTNPFVYGLSSYVGYGKYSLYFRYDLNTFFKEGEYGNNVFAGLRIGI